MKLQQALNVLLIVFSISIASSFLLEHFYHMTPCVLCNLQRFVMSFMLVVAILKRLLSPNWSVVLYSILIFFNLIGIALSARHVWLQSQPVSDLVTVQCLPSLSVLWNWLPWHDVLYTLVKGDALCQSITWTFLNLSLAMWLGILYLCILAFNICFVKKNSY
jgi:disulfide bond formation protein DsbB